MSASLSCVVRRLDFQTHTPKPATTMATTGTANPTAMTISTLLDRPSEGGDPEPAENDLKSDIIINGIQKLPGRDNALNMNGEY